MAPQLRLKIYRPVCTPGRKDAPSVSGNRLLQLLPGCRQGPSHAVPTLGIDFVEVAKPAMVNCGTRFIASAIFEKSLFF
jgi:hypothetical protein